MNKFLSLLFFLLLSLTSCHALGPILSAVDGAVHDSGQALAIIETTYNVYQASHPVSPEEHLVFERLLASAEATLRAGTRAVQDLQDVNQGKFDAAFADFRVAYAALHDYLKQHGVSPIGAGLVGAGTPGGDDFPPPAVIGLRVGS